MRAAAFVAATTLWLAASGCREDATSPTASELPIAPAPVSAAVTLAFWQVSAGGFHTCGVTTDDRAYCWGYNYYGAVGDGSPQRTTHLTRPRSA